MRFRQDLKELKFRPSTDVHDYQVRLRAAQKFIAKVRSLARPKSTLYWFLSSEIPFTLECFTLQGDKVKLTLTFKGREMQFQEIGKDLFKVRCHFLHKAQGCKLHAGQKGQKSFLA